MSARPRLLAAFVLLLAASPLDAQRRATVAAVGTRSAGHAAAACAALPGARGGGTGVAAPACPASEGRQAAWGPSRRRGGAAAPRRATPWAIAASVLLPGSGQVLLGTLRAVPYLALEGFGWWQYANHLEDEHRSRDAYRDLAARVARSRFSTVRPVGGFDYYERLRYWQESGAYDLVPGGALDPEPDSLTYNGAMWLLARRTYWPDPSQPPDSSSAAYQAALSFYARRAYGPAFRWSWRDAPGAWQEYSRLIRDSNEANRRSLQALGLVVANHLLSTVDAYVSVRVRRREPREGGGWEVAARLPLSSLSR